MKIAFRQGIVSHQTGGFLFYNAGNIDIRADERPVTVAVAHSYTNYVFSEDESLDAAWIGPFDNTKSYWLYWDFDMSQFSGACPPNQHSTFTCKRTFGRTELEPIVSDTEPASPLTGQIWFDRTNYRHFEFDGVDWIEKLRVFACQITNGNNIIPMGSVPGGGASFTGSQISDYTTVSAGRPLYGETGLIIKRDDGTFFTTEDQFFADKARIDALRLESNVYRAQAMLTSLASFTVVAWDQSGASPNAEDGRIRACTYDDVVNTVVGMVTEDLMEGEVGSVIIQGSITNPSWNWMTGTEPVRVGDPLWVNNGVLITYDPHVVNPTAYPQSRPAVARVLSDDTIVFQQAIAGIFDLDVPPLDVDQIPPALVSRLGVVRLSVPAGTGSAPITTGSTDDQPVVVETTDPRLYDRRSPLPHPHSASSITFDPTNTVFTNQVNIQLALEDVDDNFVNVTGDIMTNFLTLHSDPLSNLHPATKQYVDRLTSGYIWLEQISFANLISLSSVVVPASPNIGDVYVVPASAPAWGEPAGSVLQYRGAVDGWVKLANSLNDFSLRRFGVALESDTTPVGVTKNTLVDHTGATIYDPYTVTIPPSPAVSVTASDYPLATNNDSFNSYAWNGSRWIKTLGSTISFGNWINGNQGDNYSIDPRSYDVNSTSIGSEAESNGENSIAFGTEAKTNAVDAISMGSQSEAYAQNAISVGKYSLASGVNSITIGNGDISDRTTTTEADAIAIGNRAKSEFAGSIAIGNELETTDTLQLIIGTPVSNLILHDGIFTIQGNNAQLVVPKPYDSPSQVSNPQEGALIYTNDGKLWLFNDSTSPGAWEWINILKNWIDGNMGENFVTKPDANALNAVAVGNAAYTESVNSLVMGTGSFVDVDSDRAIVIGVGNEVQSDATDAIVIGTDIGIEFGKEVTRANVIIIGNGAASSGKNDIAMGTGAWTVGDAVSRSAIAIGENAWAGADSVVIGDNSISTTGNSNTPLPGDIPIENVTLLGSRSFSNRPNSVVIGDEVSIDTSASSPGASSFPFEGEFVKIGTTAGSEMFIMLAGDPSSAGPKVGGHLLVRGPHAQIVLPKYNPSEYTGLPGLPGPNQAVPVEHLESRPGGLIYDLEHAVEYDPYTSPKGPGDTTEPRPMVFNGVEWVPVGSDYLYELKDVDIDYHDLTRPDEMMSLIFKNDKWYPHYMPVRVNGDDEFAVQPVASGPNSIATGDSSVASNTCSIVMGCSSTTSGSMSGTIGNSSITSGDGSFTIGNTMDNSGDNTFSAGVGSTTSSNESVVIGNGITSDGSDYKISIGSNVSNTGDDAIGIGRGATVVGPDAIGMGQNATANANTITIGSSTNTANAAGSSIIGNTSTIDNLNSSIQGNNSGITADNSHIIGNSSTVSGEDSLVVGDSSTASGVESLVVGYGSTAGAADTIVVGSGSQATSVGAIAVGDTSVASGVNSLILGNSNTADSAESLVVGYGSTASANDTIVVGSQSQASAVGAIAIGDTVQSNAVGAIGIGSTIVAEGVNSFVVGSGADSGTLAEDAIVIGTDAYSDMSQSIVIGKDLSLPNTSSPVGVCENYTTLIGRGSAGTESYLSIAESGQLATHGTDAQFVLPTYTATPTGCTGGIIFDLIHPVDYDASASPPGPGNVTSGKIKVFDGTDWVITGSEFLYELKDVDIDYNDPSRPDDMMVLTYKDQIWKPQYPVIRANNDSEYTVQPLASGDNSIASGNGVVSSGNNTITLGNTSTSSADDSITVGSTNTNDAIDGIIVGNSNTLPATSSPESIAIGKTLTTNEPRSVVIGTDLEISNVASPLDSCDTQTVLIGRGAVGFESYLSVGASGQLSAHGEDAQIVLPGHPSAATSPPSIAADGCDGGVIWDSDENIAKTWKGGEWRPLDTIGGVFEVPLAMVDLFGSPPLASAADVGTPMYFSPIGSPPTSGIWKPAQASDMGRVHTCVISGITSTSIIMMVAGECKDINTVVNGGNDLIPGRKYYLSLTNPGEVIDTEPTVFGDIIAPVWVATSTNSAVVLPHEATRKSTFRSVRYTEEFTGIPAGSPLGSPGGSPLGSPTSYVGETDFTLATFIYDYGSLNVYYNGKKLNSSEYVQDVSGESFSLITPVALDTDVVEAETWIVEPV